MPFWLALKQLSLLLCFKAVPCVLAVRAEWWSGAGPKQLEPLDRDQRFRNLATGNE